MSDIRKRLLGKNLYTLVAAACLFVLAYIINRYVVDSTATRYYTHRIERDIQQKESDFDRLAGDTALLNTLIRGSYTETTLRQILFGQKHYGFFIEEKDSSNQTKLLFWNTQIVRPPVKLMDQSDGSHLIRLDNGWYIYNTRLLDRPDGRVLTVEVLIPVMWKYFMENDNLKKEFVGFPAATRWLDIAFSPTPYPVKSVDGKILFYLQKVNLNELKNNRWVVLMILLGVFLLAVYIHHVAHSIAECFGLWKGIGFLTGILLLLRAATYYFHNLFNLRQFDLFNPQIYSSSLVLSSLGDLFINALIFCWIVLFISRRITRTTFKPFREAWKNWTAVGTLALGLVGLTFIFADILQSLIADAKISFNVTNIFSLLNQYSFVGFIILATMALSYFLLSQVLLKTIDRFGETYHSYFLYIVVAFVGLLILTFSHDNAVIELNLYVMVWLLVYIWLMQRKIFSGLHFSLNVSEVLFWLFVFSFSIAAVIIFENRKIEYEQRKRFAEKLSMQADPSSERILSIALAYLDNDFLAPNFDRFRDPAENRDLKESIINKNFSAYINRYDTKIFTFDAATMPLYNEEQGSYDTLNTIFSIQGKTTSIPGLRYFEKSFDKFSYIFRRQVHDRDGNTIGYFFILSEPKEYKSDALIPELFKQNREFLPDYAPAYSYAIYNNLDLIEHYNDYPFSTHLSPEQIPKKEYEQVRKGSYDELWYKHTTDKIVIIVKKDNSFIEAITLFAYLFSTFLFLLAFFRLVSLLISSRFRWSLLRQNWQLSIRSQIHSTIIFVTLLSFLVIGVATILFFINRYNRTNQDRLSRSIQVMEKEVKNKLEDEKLLSDSLVVDSGETSDELEKVVQEIAQIHGTDVNLYDTTGNLMVSSNPFIYNKGVLSKKMNPEAFYYLHNLQSIQKITEEKIGKMDYLSMYSPVRNEQGNAFAYLDIPSYSTQIELKQEISNFVVTIINLNAFIFLIAGAIALFITNRITSSFTLIGEKMRDIKLNKTNQEIEWRRNDEIGELVEEYNKMVRQLDESAGALAKSEREGAWRQMARQVAHEIKNPLTPMKLSIQYLQKAIDNNSPNVKEMTANVARTLIEQIDHLSKIASDFSQFANIGNPKSEVFDLHEMLHSLGSLYEATDNLDYHWEPVSQRVMLFADKTQLNRLFTNLLQNALESGNDDVRRSIWIREQLNGEYITVSVQDNGEGIPEAMRSKIFTPNFTTKSSGTGLGLAMSKSIAEQARGDIWFETVEGEGTTFFVKLPLLRATD